MPAHPESWAMEPDEEQRLRENPPLAGASRQAERVEGARRLLREQAESDRLRELHKGDPAYEGMYSPQRIRRQEQLDRENDEQMRGYN